MRRRTGAKVDRKFEAQKFSSFANSKLKEYATNVVAATVPVNFTVEEFVETVWPSDVVLKLRQAFPLVHGYDQSNFAESVPARTFGLPDIGHAHIGLMAKSLEMLCPKEGLMKDYTQMDPGVARRIHTTFAGVQNVMLEYTEVFTVVQWMEEHLRRRVISLRDIKYYAPWLPSLIPAHHVIHVTTTRVPDVGIPPNMQNTMRRAAEIVVAGSLAPRPEQQGAFLSVGFSGYTMWHDAPAVSIL